MFNVVSDRQETGRELRGVFVETLQDLMKDNDRVVVCEADLGGASGTTKILASNPDRFVQCGIAEADMMGIAAGMSAEGFIPFAHTFGPFASRRVFDQVYLSGAYAHNTINIYGSDPGFCVGTNGGTHTTWDDVALMRTIPGAVVCDAADDVQMEWVVRTFAQLGQGVHYLRANRKAVRRLYEPGSTFELGRGNVLRQGSDVLIVSAGQLVSDALDAADALEQQDGLSCEVIDIVSIKPLDTELLLSEAADKRAVVTFENHGVIGGLGSAVAEVLAEHAVAVPFRRHGVVERFGQVGSPSFLQKEYGLTSEALAETVRAMLR